MVSDAAFLSEVDGFLATCNLPVLRIQNENEERPHKRSTSHFQQGLSPKNRTASPDSKCTFEVQHEPNIDTTTKDKSYYKRRKMERVNLRRQVSELTTELENLLKSNEVNKTLMAPSKWMVLAKYQEGERLKAEEQHRQLCVAVETRNAMIQDFFKLTQDRLGELGRVTEQEDQLIEGSTDEATSGPFKRIRVDPPLDDISVCYLSELNSQTDENMCDGDSENGDYGQVFDIEYANGSFEVEDTIENAIDSTSPIIANHWFAARVKSTFDKELCHFVSVMKTIKHEEEFLAEVENFLTTCDLPPLTSNLESTNKIVENSPFTSTAFNSSLSIATDGIQRRNDYGTSSKRMLKKANDRTRSRSYYQRRQEEFQHLRQQVKKLTLTLAEQQKGRPESKAQLSTPWRLMAQWQRNARLNAETQHRRLRAAVDTRATLIHELQTFLHDRLRLISDESHLFKHNKFHRSASDVNIFALRAQELDMIYAQTDKILHDFSLESTIDSWNAPKQSWKEDRQSGHFLYMNEQTISSEFQETCRFLWQIAFMTHRQENRDQFDDMEDPENTVAMKFRITTRLNSGAIASVLQTVVTRRYQEGKRMVLAWRSLTEGEGMFTGMVAEETGWCVATPTRNNDTLLRTYMRHVPMHFRGIVAHHPEAKQFTSFVLDTGSNDIFETTTKLEELLKKM